jgi:hypothetical protein
MLTKINGLLYLYISILILERKMSHVNLDKWSKISKQMQESFQAIAALNLKTLEEFSSFKTEDFALLKKPEDMFKRQIQLVVENSYRTLDCMQESYQIMEKGVSVLTETAKTEFAKEKSESKKN